ncbi:hypothetical protein [Aureivirga sp. CE67]|uniref:hypothetical protein n=1 Tax=Aureivirga sp. CE67 TaxID=1788983 RepID=UPI0018CA6A54|nr:hypothetical protein [Aureivirga sp. CE67]
MKKHLLFIFLIISIVSFGQSKKEFKELEEKVDSLELIIKEISFSKKLYQRELKLVTDSIKLKEETRKEIVKSAITERQNMENHFKYLFWVFSTIVLLILFVLGFIGWKNKKDVEKEMKHQILESVSLELSKLTSSQIEEAENLILENSRLSKLKKETSIIILSKSHNNFIESFLNQHGFKNTLFCLIDEFSAFEDSIHDSIIFLYDKENNVDDFQSINEKISFSKGVFYFGRGRYINNNIIYLNYCNSLSTVRLQLLELLRTVYH